jgi:hypothetical protein
MIYNFMISFNDWVAAQMKESSPFTRLRQDAALGLKPPIPDASIHSHGTGTAVASSQAERQGQEEKEA